MCTCKLNRCMYVQLARTLYINDILIWYIDTFLCRCMLNVIIVYFCFVRKPHVGVHRHLQICMYAMLQRNTIPDSMYRVGVAVSVWSWDCLDCFDCLVFLRSIMQKIIGKFSWFRLTKRWWTDLTWRQRQWIPTTTHSISNPLRLCQSQDRSTTNLCSLG